MTTQEQIEYLATKVMGWERHCRNTAHWTDVKNANEVDYKMRAWYGDWNPLTDWSHWRQVEEKVLSGDGLLLAAFLKRRLAVAYVVDDLPTRCAALISAHRILYGN